MKVLHLSHSDWQGGAARAAFRIHRGLKKFDVDSSLCVKENITKYPGIISPDSLLSRVWGRFVGELDRGILHFQSSRNVYPRHVAFFGMPLRKRIQRFDADLLQLHWICGGMLRLEALLNIEIPVVWRFPDIWAFAGTEHISLDTRRLTQGYLNSNRSLGDGGIDIDKWTYNRKRKIYNSIRSLTVVCPSRWMAEQVKRSPLFENRRIEVIPTGIDIDVFKPLDKRFCRRALNLSDDKYYLLYVSSGQITQGYKGFKILKESLEYLMKSGPHTKEIELIVAGCSNLPLDLRPNIKTHLLGRLFDEASLALVYNACDLFVAPYLLENLPNTLIEALACEVPSVGFQAGGIPELIEHNRTGLLVKEFSATALAKALRTLIDDPSLANKMKSAGRVKICEYFSEMIQACQYLALYNDILSEFTKECR